jgi:hypothetical protein
MKVKNAIVVVAAIVAVFASVATTGGVVQQIQDTGVSVSDPGFVPSTGQINLGYDPKLPDNSLARGDRI